MKIEQLILHEGIFSSTDKFSPKRNLIFSETNSKGKSTYLRLLFFSLGFQIPDMKGTKFRQKVATEVIFSEKGQKFKARRQGDLLVVETEENRLEFTLPSQHLSFLSYIFNYQNIKVLSNLLGLIYIDQEKGWTLLNRGVVIGSNKFNIEELLAGLNGTDIDSLKEKEKILAENEKKYQSMSDIGALTNQIIEQTGEIFVSDYEKELNNEIAYCNVKLEKENNYLKEIKSVMLKDEQFFKYINSMNLYVRYGNETIPVNKQTLVNSEINYENLRARQSIIVTNIERIKREKANFEERLKQYYSQNKQVNLVYRDNDETIINRQLATLNINQGIVNQLLDKTKKELRDTRAKIKNLVKCHNSNISKIYQNFRKYAEELGIKDKISLNEDFIFTSDLKSLSGAVLSKMTFALKVACIKVVEEAMNTKLFMVLDSPNGKEMDSRNMKLIEKIVEEELADNQIFYASIYDIKCENKIEIKHRAIEERAN